MNSKLSDKDKKDWQKFISGKNKIQNKDLKIESDKFFFLLEKTNSFWNLFNSDTNLRADYQLQALLVEWSESVGLSR